jgi:NAD(P)H-hydrate epimerase
MSSSLPMNPILTCAEAKAWEQSLLGDEVEKSYAAMQRAGAGVGVAILRDFVQWRPLPRDPKVLVLAGPGHNGGDALLAAQEILRARPRGQATVIFLEPVEKLKPLAKRAWEELAKHSGVEAQAADSLSIEKYAGQWNRWDITLDGLYGMGFRPPLPDNAQKLITVLNQISGALGFRAAVDVPSGVGEKPANLAFMADFTYATGIAKTPLFEAANAKWVGRIRYIDLGFFDQRGQGDKILTRQTQDFILLPAALNWLGRLRDSASDKRTYGKVLIVSGSRAYPGAQMLNVLGALRAGAGLVTALTPAAHAAAFAAERPEAMWRACAEETDGSQGAATLAEARILWKDATAVLAGSGLGKGEKTQQMLLALVRECPSPLVLDADALTPEVLAAVTQRPMDFGSVILTPHAGEYERLGGKGVELREFCAKHKVVVVCKGPVTRIANAKGVWCSTFGGPVLARGGSGDILAGIIAALLAQDLGSATNAANCGVVWHGLAADALARERGETAVFTAELANFMPAALRNDWGH